MYLVQSVTSCFNMYNVFFSSSHSSLWKIGISTLHLFASSEGCAHEIRFSLKQSSFCLSELFSISGDHAFDISNKLIPNKPIWRILTWYLWFEQSMQFEVYHVELLYMSQSLSIKYCSHLKEENCWRSVLFPKF